MQQQMGNTAPIGAEAATGAQAGLGKRGNPTQGQRAPGISRVHYETKTQAENYKQ